MSKFTTASKAAQHQGDQASSGHSLRGALVLLAAAVMLVGGTYYVVFSLTGPNGLVTHMASQASADVEGRTLSVAAENY
jgi:fermentation-respiration switch protein FrsA (DUF1100 family)